MPKNPLAFDSEDCGVRRKFCALLLLAPLSCQGGRCREGGVSRADSPRGDERIHQEVMVYRIDEPSSGCERVCRWFGHSANAVTNADFRGTKRAQRAVCVALEHAGLVRHGQIGGIARSIGQRKAAPPNDAETTEQASVAARSSFLPHRHLPGVCGNQGYAHGFADSGARISSSNDEYSHRYHFPSFACRIVTGRGESAPPDLTKSLAQPGLE